MTTVTFRSKSGSFKPSAELRSDHLRLKFPSHHQQAKEELKELQEAMPLYDLPENTSV